MACHFSVEVYRENALCRDEAYLTSTRKRLRIKPGLNRRRKECPDGSRREQVVGMAENTWSSTRNQASVRLHSMDGYGRLIDPNVLNVAQSIAARAIQYAESIIRDTALAASLLEESAASVSCVVRKRAQLHKPPIANIEAYLFRAFIRRVNVVRQKEPLTSASSMFAKAASLDGTRYSEQLDMKILADEFVTRCDPVTREMFYRRIRGFSWKEIGRFYGISAHAAEARFSQNLKKVCRRLGLK